MIRCSDDTFYTGIATNVARRLDEHRTGKVGAKYLRGRAPLEVVFEKQVGDRSIASKIEYKIKKLSRSKKEQLVQCPAELFALIDNIY